MKLFRKLLEIMVCYDQLNVGALASAELAGRQIQMIEERWKENVMLKVQTLTDFFGKL